MQVGELVRRARTKPPRDLPLRRPRLRHTRLGHHQPAYSRNLQPRARLQRIDRGQRQLLARLPLAGHVQPPLGGRQPHHLVTPQPEVELVPHPPGGMVVLHPPHHFEPPLFEPARRPNLHGRVGFDQVGDLAMVG